MGAASPVTFDSRFRTKDGSFYPKNIYIEGATASAGAIRDRGVSGNLQLGANAPILADHGREGRVTRRVVTESSDVPREDKYSQTTSTTFQRCTVDGKLAEDVSYTYTAYKVRLYDT